VLVRQAAQPSYFPQCDALPRHSTASRTDKASLSVIASSAPSAPSYASRLIHRQRLEPVFPIGTLFAQHGLGVQRRSARCLSPRLPIRHSILLAMDLH